MIYPALTFADDWGLRTPHPFRPLNVIWDSEAHGANRPQPQWAQVRSRKARILAAARKLLAEGGYERLTVKNLASEADLSVPTIYNLVGKRHDVLVQAMNDHTIAMCKTAKDKEKYPHFVMALADLYANLAKAYPEFIKATTIAYFSGNDQLFNPWHDCGVGLIVASLAESQRAGLLRPGMTPEKIGRRCSAAISMSVYEWAIGSISKDELRAELAYAAGDSLMRALTLPASAALEEWLGRTTIPS